MALGLSQRHPPLPLSWSDLAIDYFPRFVYTKLRIRIITRNQGAKVLESWLKPIWLICVWSNFQGFIQPPKEIIGYYVKTSTIDYI